MLGKRKRWFHSSPVELLLVNKSASWILVAKYLIWIVGSQLIPSNNRSGATLCVRDTCLFVGLQLLVIILIIASLSTKGAKHGSQVRRFCACDNVVHIRQLINFSVAASVLVLVLVCLLSISPCDGFLCAGTLISSRDGFLAILVVPGLKDIPIDNVARRVTHVTLLWVIICVMNEGNQTS